MSVFSTEDLERALTHHLTPHVNISRRIDRDGLWLTVAWGGHYFQRDIGDLVQRSPAELIFNVTKIGEIAIEDMARAIAQRDS